MVTFMRQIGICTSAVCFAHGILLFHLSPLFSLSLNYRLEMDLRRVRNFTVCDIDYVIVVSLFSAIRVC